MLTGTDWRRRKERRQEPAARRGPQTPSASVRPQRLPRVGPGRRGHPPVPGGQPPDQPAAAGRHPLHPLLHTTPTQPAGPRPSGSVGQSRTNRGEHHPRGFLTLMY